MTTPYLPKHEKHAEFKAIIKEWQTASSAFDVIYDRYAIT